MATALPSTESLNRSAGGSPPRTSKIKSLSCTSIVSIASSCFLNGRNQRIRDLQHLLSSPPKGSCVGPHLVGRLGQMIAVSITEDRMAIAPQTGHRILQHSLRTLQFLAYHQMVQARSVRVALKDGKHIFRHIRNNFGIVNFGAWRMNSRLRTGA
jgi:hypothetical protein